MFIIYVVHHSKLDFNLSFLRKVSVKWFSQTFGLCWHMSYQHHQWPATSLAIPFFPLTTLTTCYPPLYYFSPTSSKVIADPEEATTIPGFAILAKYLGCVLVAKFRHQKDKEGIYDWKFLVHVSNFFKTLRDKKAEYFKINTNEHALWNNN